MQQVAQKSQTLSHPKSHQIAKKVLILQITRKIHLSAFLMINLFLFGINVFITRLSTYPWFLWVLVSWGIVLIYHIRYNIIRCLYLEGKKPHLGYFLMELSAGIGFFVFIKVISQNPYNWFVWTILGYFLFTVAMHFIFIPRIYRKRKKVSPRSSIATSPSEINMLNFISLESRSQRFCPGCGAKIGGGYLFCESCGFQINKENPHNGTDNK